MGTAALPSFSEQVAGGDYERLKRTISFSLRLILFVTIPAMVALIILRVPIISVLFQRGQFDATSTLFTAQALLYYAVGLWAFSCIRVVVSAFYALQDTRTPVRVAVVALLVNVVMAVALMFPMKHSGLALATSIASAVNIIALAVILRKRVGQFLQRDFWTSVLRTTLASGIMGVSIGIAGRVIGWDTAGAFGERLLFLVVMITVGLAIFTLSSFLLGSVEVKALLRRG